MTATKDKFHPSMSGLLSGASCVVRFAAFTVALVMTVVITFYIPFVTLTDEKWKDAHLQLKTVVQAAHKPVDYDGSTANFQVLDYVKASKHIVHQRPMTETCNQYFDNELHLSKCKSEVMSVDIWDYEIPYTSELGSAQNPVFLLWLMIFITTAFAGIYFPLTYSSRNMVVFIQYWFLIGIACVVIFAALKWEIPSNHIMIALVHGALSFCILRYYRQKAIMSSPEVAKSQVCLQCFLCPSMSDN